MKPRAAWVAAMVAIVLVVAVMLPAGREETDREPTPVDATALARLADQAAFRQFVDEFRREAVGRGIAPDLYDRVFAGIEPDPDVVERDRNQAEFNTAIHDYLARRVSEERISRGRELARAMQADLASIEGATGVDRHLLLAVWGIESNYGGFTGDKGVVRSLATLAYEGRRTAYGRGQLLAALEILARGDVEPDRFTGSWAGAMGHTQFIPTTFNAYAVDWDGDGRRDIWGSVPDALASAASYLAKRGWSAELPWGFEVNLPTGFDYGLVGEAGQRSLAEWARLGVEVAEGGRFGLPRAEARLLLPAGAAGPAFLVTANFRAILAYNNSTAYALAVAHLSDRLRGKAALVRPWPQGEAILTRNERIELQTLLTARGFDTGGTSGHFGSKTLAAIQAYQRAAGLVPDGHATAVLLERMRRDR